MGNKHTTQEDMRILTGRLNAQTLREVISSLIDIEHGQHFVVECTEGQHKILVASMSAEAKSCGLEAVIDPDNEVPVNFFQWFTGITISISHTSGHFLVKQVKVSKGSIIVKDLTRAQEALVTRIENGTVYVTNISSNPSKDAHQGCEYRWEGSFLVIRD